MSSDANEHEFSDFELEEIALGRGQSARRRLSASASDDPARARLASIRSEVELFRDVLESAADADDVESINDDMLARFLDGSLDDDASARVERALAGSVEARQRLVSLYRETRACEAGDPIPKRAEGRSVARDSEEGVIVPYASDGAAADAPQSGAVGRYLGLSVAAAFVGIAYFGPSAWQIPFAFGAVVATAMVGIHLAGSGSSIGSGRAWGLGLVLCAVAGMGLAVAVPGRVAGACSVVGCALILLFARVSLHRNWASVEGLGAADDGAVAEDPERKRRVGGGNG